MELLHKLERKVLGWTQKAPHLPVSTQKWLGNNVWWIVLIGTIIGGLAALISLIGLFGLIALLGAPSSVYYVYGGVTAWAIVTALIGLVFSIATVVISAFAISPLQKKQKKGWVLLFATWLLYIVYIIVSAVLTLNPFSFLFTLIFGALFAAIGAYFLFEVHGQFDHGVRPVKTKAKKA